MVLISGVETRRMNLRFRLCFGVLPLACHATLAIASPTSQDYEVCHRQASWILQECLNDNAGHPDPCWSKARSEHEACYAKVNKGYRRDNKERIEAEKLERERLAKEKQQK